jgi:hypothetical protein
MTPENNVSGAEISTAGVLVVKTGSTPAERMRVDASGNVGIGTSTPRAGVKLDVASTGEAVISVTDLDQANTWGNFSHNNGLTQFISRNGDSFGSFVWYGADGSTFPERMRISDAGNVGIGVIPNTFAGIDVALQMGNGLTNMALSTNAYRGANYYYEDGYKYRGTGVAHNYVQDGNGHLWFTAATGSSGQAISWSEVMRIDTNGNVGIGTTSGIGKVNIKTSTDRNLSILTDDVDGKLNITAVNDAITDNVDLRIQAETITFKTNAVDRAFIDSAGNVGIGTSSPNAKLTIKKDGGGTEPSVGGELQLIASTSSINPPIQWLIGDSLLGDIRFGRADSITSFPNSYSMIRGLYGSGDARRTLLTFFTSDTGDSTERMRIDSSGNVGIGTSSPTAPLDTAGVRIGRNFSLTGRATVRLDSANTSSPSDVLFGHTAAANQDGWNGVYWSLSSRASENNNRFALFRGAGNPGGGGEAIVMIWEPNGSVLPGTNATQDLGSASLRWNTVYTSDLSLKNDHGDWTIVEGEDDLFLYNNKKNKVYKFALTEVDPSIAPAKRD